MPDVRKVKLLFRGRRVNCSYPMRDVKAAVRPALRAAPKAVVSMRVRVPQRCCGGWSLFTDLNYERVTKFHLSDYRFYQACALLPSCPSLGSKREA